MVNDSHITLEPASSSPLGINSHFDGNSSIDEIERRAIFATLRKTKNNRTKASKILDISVRTLRNKLNLYKEKNILPAEFILGEDVLDQEE